MSTYLKIENIFLNYCCIKKILKIENVLYKIVIKYNLFIYLLLKLCVVVKAKLKKNWFISSNIFIKKNI